MKRYIMPGVLIIFSIILIYQSYSLKTIKEDLENIKSTNTSLEEEVRSLGSELSSQVQSTLEEELGKSHLTKDVNFELNKNTDKGYDLTVRAELSELKQSSKVIFMYKDENSKNWQALELKQDSELSYAGKFHIPYNNDYKYKILIKGDKTESSDVEDLDKYLFVPSLPDVSWSYNNEGIYFSAYPYTEDKSEEESHENKIKSIEIILNDNKEKTYKCEYSKEPIYDENNEIIDESNHYEANIQKKAYNNKLESIKIKVTYENGIINMEDVTNNLME